MQIGFYVGIIALIVSTMVGLGVVSATTFCKAIGFEPDSKIGIYIPIMNISDEAKVSLSNGKRKCLPLKSTKNALIILSMCFIFYKKLYY